MNTTSSTSQTPRRLNRLRVRGGSVFLRGAGLAALLALSAPALYATPIHSDPTGGDGGGSIANGPAASPGPIPSWVGQYGDVSTGTGNKVTAIPIVSWTARGGLPVGFSLVHASESNRGGSFGPKWSLNVFSSLAIWTDNSGVGHVTAYWGDQSAYTFNKNADGSYTAPPGIHDKLVNNGSSYDLTTKSQVRYHFVQNAGFPSYYYFNTSISDENGNTVAINLDPSTGKLQSVVDPTGRSITFGYGGGHMTTVTDPENHVWTLAYDGSGRLWQVHQPLLNGGDAWTQISYDGNNNVNAQSDFKGQWAYATYNADSTVATETDRAGNQTTFSYTSTATTITDANGHSIVQTYNGNGQLGSTIDQQNKVEAYGYDGNNNRIVTQDRRGNYWNYSFDGMGNMLSAQAPATPENSNGNTTHWTYNGHSRPLTVTVPSGRSVALTYDGNDNLTQVQQKDASGNVLATTGFTVSAGTHGLVTDKYDANGHHYQYGYDGNGYLNDLYTPLGRHTHWDHATLGAIYRRIDAMNRTTTYTRDAWDRTTAHNYPDSSQWTYGYDINSNLDAFANPGAGSYIRTYDADNRLTNEYENGNHNLHHAYDAPGQRGLLSSTTDNAGRVITYAYSPRNELQSVAESGQSTSYAYDQEGAEANVTNPNGTLVGKEYDSAGRLKGIWDETSGGGIIRNYNYAYSMDSQKVLVSENGGATVAYGYDGLGQLTSEIRSGDSNGSYTEYYGYGLVGERTAQQINGAHTNLSYDTDDELLSTSGAVNASFGYDANGNQTSRTVNGQSWTLNYTYDNDMTGISGTGGGTASASYGLDALGRRIFRGANGLTTKTFFDGGQPLQDMNANTNTQIAAYTYGNEQVRRNGECPLYDGYGGVRAITDANQNVTDNLNFDAFGVLVGVNGSTSDPYLWGSGSDYRSDGDGGLVEVGARDYDPTFGRFITRDTDLSESPYAYCDGDPVDFTDPTGHKKPWWQTLLGKLFGTGVPGLSGPLGGIKYVPPTADTYTRTVNPSTYSNIHGVIHFTTGGSTIHVTHGHGGYFTMYFSL